jgi:hypothetical protein
LLIAALFLAGFRPGESDLGAEYTEKIKPVLARYCLDCHSTKKKKGDLDLERFSSLDAIRKDLKPWPMVVENLDNGEMPPKKSAQPTAEERRALAAWTRSMLDAEARARAGDPGRVVVRRLSNAEYNRTIRDLTGVDLEPARDFPADGAAGEGFTNSGDALVMSPTLLNKYLNAAKEIASHAVLVPDGFRFSPAKTQRDWSDEGVAALRKFYAPYGPEGKLPVRPYLAAAIRCREDLAAGKFEVAAARENLSPRYLRLLWEALNDARPSFPLDRIRGRWRAAAPKDVDAIMGEISAWQTALWAFVRIGSYYQNKVARQEPNYPPLGEVQTVKAQPKAPQGEVVLYLSTLEYPEGTGGGVLWQRARFVSGSKPPLLLKDYAAYGARYEADLRALFGRTADYLEAVLEARKKPLREVAAERSLDAAWLARWAGVLALEPKATIVVDADQMTPVAPLEMLDVEAPKNEKHPTVRGWKVRSGDLPAVLSNASDKTEMIPGRASPHKVVVHPSPEKYAAAEWRSPIGGRVRIDSKVSHVHAGCGNGIAWWLEVRRADRGAMLAEGTLGAGSDGPALSRELELAAGDSIVLAVDPREGNHVCDLTEINLSLTEVEGGKRAWDLGRDVADTMLEGNPHADRLGNRDVWRFVAGPAVQGGAKPAAFKIPGDSVLGKWRAAAIDPKRSGEVAELARQVQAVLAGDRPAKDKSPEQVLYDGLAWIDGPLFQGVDVARLIPNRPPAATFGLPTDRFREADLAARANDVIEVRVPAALFRDYEFVVDGRLAAGGLDRVVQFRVSTTPPAAGGMIAPSSSRGAAPPAAVGSWSSVADGKSTLVAAPGSAAAKDLFRGFEDFRRLFPYYVCFPAVIPTDEVVCLKMYHREDEPLMRLLLDDEQAGRLDRIWKEHQFITQWPVAENQYLPQFIGYVTQDAPKEALVFFQGLTEPWRRRAEEFRKVLDAAEPRHREALLRFAAKAYRRPLTAGDRAKIAELYDGLRKKEMSHAEAVRGVLARVLVSPAFLFRLEETPAGAEAQPVSDAELATRLSYFLWASTPDEDLLRAAAEGRLRDPAVLSAEVDRMVKDGKLTGLATEFAAQWLHVRNLRQNREKNEKLFPTFDDGLRDALFEETVRLFVDLFQNGRPARDLLDADYTWLNERLAAHYGIPGVQGPQWRRVEGVRKHGRGGVLALGSVLTQESGASRTSPVLRGNWLVETLLGEKLPKPPANVPRLPEDENAGEGTVREMVARHTRVPECAACHVRIDPFGFAMEKYDPIGRFRSKDLGGRPVDVSVVLKDGTKFEGLEGLRAWLLEKRRKDVERTFSQKLLGYALGRAVTLSDQPLIDLMVAGLEQGGPLSGALRTVVASRQFRYHRAAESTKEE